MSLEPFPFPAWLVDCTIQGSIAIGLVIVLVPLVRRFLGAQAAYLLWAIVILKLLVPWLPAAPYHWGPPSLQAEQSVASSPSPALTVTTVVRTGEPATQPASDFALQSPASPQPSKKIDEPRQAVPWATIPVFLWLAGMVTILGLAVFRSLRADRLVRRARRLPDDLRVGEWEALTGSLVQVRETAELRSPALVGIFRPTILLPLDWRKTLTDSQLRCVITHELGHFHRGDLLWRWVFLVVRSVHWFNPLIWWAERRACADQEMACDEWTLQRAQTSDPQAYGEALIISAQRLRDRRFSFPVQAGMAESRAGLKRRVRHLVRVRPRGWGSMVAGLALSVILLLLTGPARSESPVAPAAANDPIYDPEVRRATLPDAKAADATPTPAPALRVPISKPGKWMGIRIESKFVEMPPELADRLLAIGGAGSDDATLGVRAVLSRGQFENLIRQMDRKGGVEIMSAPTVTTNSEKHATINIIREFRYPKRYVQSAEGQLPVTQPVTPSEFATRNLGITLDVEPTFTPFGDIDLKVAPEVVNFDGFVDFGGQRPAKEDGTGDPLADVYQPSAEGVINQPIFSVRQTRTRLTLHNGETVALGGFTSDFGRVLPEDFKPEPPKSPRRTLFVFVTVTAFDEDGHLVGGPAFNTPPPSVIPPPPIQANGKFYGMVVPNKPGFVTSPYAPGAGYVDVRGLATNAEVKDPYTGQMFLVPASDSVVPPQSLPDPNTTLGKALRIVIPAIEFKDMSLNDALGALRSKSAELDDQPDVARRGLNLVLKLPGQTKASRRITAKLTNISLFEALRFVAATNDLVVVDEPYALSIQPPEVGPLVIQKYQVPEAFLSAVQATKPSDLKSFWRAHGMDFPPGAFVSFTRPSELVVRDTKEEHEKLQRLFAAPASTP